MLNPLPLYPPPQGPLGAGRSPPKRASLPRKKRQYRGDSVFEIDGGTAFFGLCAERASISDLGRSWGASRAPFGLLLGHLGCLLGSFWAPLGPSWGHLGAILGHLGAILHPSWPSWSLCHCFLLLVVVLLVVFVACCLLLLLCVVCCCLLLLLLLLLDQVSHIEQTVQ